MKTILQRTVSGIVYLILIIGSLLWGCIPFGILLLCIGTIALYEFYRLTNGTGNSAAMIAGLISGCLIIIIAFLVSSGALKPAFLSCNLLIILMLFMLALFTNREKKPGNMANQLLGILYISVPLAVSTYLIFPNHKNTGEKGQSPFSNAIWPLF